MFHSICVQSVLCKQSRFESSWPLHMLHSSTPLSLCSLYFGLPNLCLWATTSARSKTHKMTPCSNFGHFLGLSSLHSSEIPLGQNIQSGSRTPQFHVVFPDLFSIAPLMAREDDPPGHWDDVQRKHLLFLLMQHLTQPLFFMMTGLQYLKDRYDTVKLRNLTISNRYFTLKHHLLRGSKLT